MKTVVIEVLGGVVQAVHADDCVQVIVVDWDARRDDPTETCAWKYHTGPLYIPDEAKGLVAPSTDD